MHLIFLGTGSAVPTKSRNVSSYALRFDNGKIFLFDCGEGTQQQLLRYNQTCKPELSIKLSNIQAIFITHLHGDHSFGLPGLLATISTQSHPDKLMCYGPVGLKAMIETSLKLSDTYLTYKLEIVELMSEAITLPLIVSDMTCAAFPLVHKVPCFGYLIQESTLPGRFDPNKAQELGVTNKKDFGLLSKGQDIQLPSGQIIKSSDVVGPSRPGRSFLLLGDTSNSDRALGGADCDVLVHECTFASDQKELAIKAGHSTAEMAGAFARLIGAKRLILTHFSSRYDESGIPQLVQEAQTAARSIPVQAASDFEVIVI